MRLLDRYDRVGLTGGWNGTGVGVAIGIEGDGREEGRAVGLRDGSVPWGSSFLAQSRKAAKRMSEEAHGAGPEPRSSSVLSTSESAAS